MEVTRDAALGGSLRLTQPKRGHRFGHDAILLAAAVSAKSGERVVEFGAGVGAAGLALMSRVSGIDLTLLEIEPALTALANENISANGFSKSARALTLDVGASEQEFARAHLRSGSFDHVLMNPPFNTATLQASPDALRRRAYAAKDDLLFVWIAGAARLLRSGGVLTLIWRAEGLNDILATSGTEFGSVSILPIHSIEGEEPIRVICRAVKGGKESPRILPGFVLNDRTKKPALAAEAVLREAMPLPLALP
jgi:tRNA1(Val) A37 N6-methylase TrmN6